MILDVPDNMGHPVLAAVLESLIIRRIWIDEEFFLNNGAYGNRTRGLNNANVTRSQLR